MKNIFGESLALINLTILESLDPSAIDIVETIDDNIVKQFKAERDLWTI